MKANLRFIALLFTSILLLSCQKEEIQYDNAFERSYQEWLDFKESSGDSYRYLVTGSMWAGTSWWTILTVENGEVTQRDFRYDVFQNVKASPSGWSEEEMQEILDAMNLTAQEFRENYGQKLSELLEWTEEMDELDSHEDTSATPLMTLDEVYDRARSHWLQKRPDVKTYFEANNNGLISSCGYVEDGCQDDCFNGIRIASIVKLQ